MAKKKYIAAVTLSLGIVLASSPAHAGPFDMLMGAITSMTTSISSTVANTMTGLKDVLVDSNAKNTKAQMAHKEALEDAKMEADAYRRHQLTVNPCETLAASAYAVSARQASRAKASSLQSEFSAYNQLTRVPGEAAMAALDRHSKSYCGEISQRLGVCTKNSGFPDADIQIGTVLSGAGMPGKGDDLVFTPEQVTAAKAYIATTVNPLPTQQVSKDTLSISGGQAYASMKLTEESRLSVMNAPFSDAVAWRSPVTVNGQAFGDIILSIWENMGGLAIISPDVYANLKKNKGQASYLLFQQTEVDRRYANPDWYMKVANISNSEQLQQEMLFMDALELSLFMEMLKRQEKIELLLATIGAIQHEDSGFRKKIEEKASTLNRANAQGRAR